MQPFFSVILCTFNRAKLISRAINSLLAQTYTDWEAIVVDDGSVDETHSVLQKYVEADLRIRYLRGDNRGIGCARNVGIRNSRGMFVTFLDSDDEYEANHLETRRAMFLDNQEVRFLHGGVRIVGDEFVPDKDNPHEKVHILDCAIGGTFVIRRDVFDEVGLFDEVRFADDALFYNRVVNHGITTGKTEFPSYVYYRDTPDSLCSTYGSVTLK